MFLKRQPTLAHGDVIDVEGVAVRLRVDARARRVSLRLDTSKREMVATAPTARALPEAVRFAQSRADWMAGLLGKLPESRPFMAGAVISVGGRPCRIEHVVGRRSPGLIDDEHGLRLLAAGEGEAFRRAIVRALKAEALRVLRERTYVHCAALGVEIPEVKVMEAKSRWGSCTPPRRGKIGRIRYSWRLILAPYDVMDYVAAHETAHLVRADHSPAFWAEVAKLVPHVKQSRAWLRAHGATLHGMG
ncbi:MAG: M48 family metallopeptidase [Caulobacteraceae bacterium]